MYTDYNEENDNNYYVDDDNNQKFNKEKFKRIAFYAIIALIVIVLVIIIAKGCANRKNENNNNPDMSIYFANPNITISVGESYLLSASVSGSKNATQVLTWDSEDSDIASVNEEGYVTGENEGTTYIIASYKENGRSVKNKCQVNVTSKIVEIENLAISQNNVTMKVGSTFLVQVEVTPTDAKVDNLVYESSDTTVATVDEYGYVSAKAIGTTTITAKTSDGRLSSSIEVTVTKDGMVEINPTSLMLYGIKTGLTIGTTSEIVYDLLPDSATNRKLTWSSSNPSIATVKDGVVTGLKEGKCTITATTENNISSSIDITVESNRVPVDSIIFNGNSIINMKVGGTKQLNYTILPNNATNKRVTYTTSNSSVVYVDSSGILRAMSAGDALITITTDDGNKKVEILVEVVDSNSSSGGSSGSSGSSGSGDSGSGSSSSGESSESGGSSSSSYSDSTDSCGVDSIIIKSNQTGAVVSNIGFANAKAFTKGSAGLLVTKYDSCVKSALYTVSYSQNNPNSLTQIGLDSFPKLNNTLWLTSRGNGYYKIKLTITTNEGNTYTKYYYAIVDTTKSIGTDTSTTDTKSNKYIKVTRDANNRFTVQRIDSSITKVYYCVTNGSSCAPVAEVKETNSLYNGYNIFGKSLDTHSWNMSYSVSDVKYNSGKNICTQAYDTSGKKFLGTNLCLSILNK